MTTLSGQTALITGASQGIGQAIAKTLAAQGIHLILTARNTQKLEVLATEIRQAHPNITVTVIAPVDVSRLADVERLVTDALAAHPSIDILVNNAGVAAKIGLLQEVPVADIDRIIDTNLKAPLYLMRLLLPQMVHHQRGTIININSVAGKTAYPYWSVYDASKFGLHAVTEAVGEEQRSNGIKVVGIYPGAVDTAIWDNLELEPHRENMLTPADVANAVLYVLQQPAGAYVPEIVLKPVHSAL